MNKEQYVSFEVSKLLKEKGFDWECDSWTAEYTTGVELHTGMERRNYNDDNVSLYDGLFSAPTQQLAMRWLREVHKIDISVTPDDGSWWIKATELEYWSSVFNGKVLNSDDIKYAYKGDTNTKEECYEAALWYVIKNLI